MSFEQDKELAVIGEFVVWNALTKMKSIKEVLDVREDKRFQDWDVDLLVKDSDMQVYMVEVKTDWMTFTTGNVIYEAESNGNTGCLERTRADVIAYFVPQSGNIYLLRSDKLRNLVRECGYPLVDMARTNRGYKVPLSDCERFGVLMSMIQTEPLPIEKRKET